MIELVCDHCGRKRRLYPSHNFDHETNDPSPKLDVLHLREGLGQRKTVLCGLLVRASAGSGALSKKNPGLTCRMWEICCNRLASDTVRAVLVFLHGLPGQPQRIAKLGLTHLDHPPAHTDPITDVFVGRVWRFFQDHGQSGLRLACGDRSGRTRVLTGPGSRGTCGMPSDRK